MYLHSDILTYIYVVVSTWSAVLIDESPIDKLSLDCHLAHLIHLGLEIYADGGCVVLRKLVLCLTPNKRWFADEVVAWKDCSDGDRLSFWHFVYNSNDQFWQFPIFIINSPTLSIQSWQNDQDMDDSISLIFVFGTTNLIHFLSNTAQQIDILPQYLRILSNAADPKILSTQSWRNLSA